MYIYQDYIDIIYTYSYVEKIAEDSGIRLV